MSVSWRFPDVPFNIEDKSGSYMQCSVIAEDDETLTFDYTANTTGARMRLQMLKDNIQTISYPTPTVEQLENMMNRESRS